MSDRAKDRILAALPTGCDVIIHRGFESGERNVAIIPHLISSAEYRLKAPLSTFLHDFWWWFWGIRIRNYIVDILRFVGVPVEYRTKISNSVLRYIPIPKRSMDGKLF